MRIITLFLVLMTTYLSYGQEETLPGYYITGSDERVNGYFQQGDFYNAGSLMFKADSASEFTKLPVDYVKEYGIGDQFRFKKHYVKVDISQSQSVRKYSQNRDPHWVLESLFLNYIVEGDASLFSYNYNGETKYFYLLKSENNVPQQLVYKKYIRGSQVLENSAYRQELFIKLKCNGQNIVGSRLTYSRSSLKNAITKYNECNGGEQTIYDNKGSDVITAHLAVYVGANMSTLKVESEDGSDSVSDINPGVGAEFSLLFPSKKWGVFARLEFEKFNEEGEIVRDLGFQQNADRYEIDATFASLSFGPRYFFTEKIFADIGVGFNLGLGNLYERRYGIVEGNDPVLTFERDFNLGMHLYAGAGLGYIINDKFSVMVNYAFNRNTISKDINTDIKNSKLSLNVRYSFF